MRLGALGIKVKLSGRLNGADIARSEWYREGQVPLHTLRADVDYGFVEAATTYGILGVKVWIYKGDILAHDPMDTPAMRRAKERLRQKQLNQEPSFSEKLSQRVSHTIEEGPEEAAEREEKELQKNMSFDLTKKFQPQKMRFFDLNFFLKKPHFLRWNNRFPYFHPSFRCLLQLPGSLRRLQRRWQRRSPRRSLWLTRLVWASLLK